MDDFFMYAMKIIKKGQTNPVYSVSQTEALNVFNYWFKVGNRSLIACVIF